MRNTGKVIFSLLVLIVYTQYAQAQAPNIQWQKSWGGTANDMAYGVVIAKDGNYVVGGNSQSTNGDATAHYADSTKSDIWLLKLDTGGTVIWQKNYGGTESDLLYKFQSTTDGGFILIGYTYSNDFDVSGAHGSSDYWVAKLDSAGTIEWQKSLGGTNIDFGYSVNEALDGGYFVNGWAYSNNGDVSGNHGGNGDYWVAKLSGNGTIKWKKCLGGSNTDIGTCIQHTLDGGCLVAGQSQSTNGDVKNSHGNNECWVVKLDSLGAIKWSKCWGGTGNETPNDLRITRDSGFIMVATTNSDNSGDVDTLKGQFDCWVVKMKQDGTLQWQKNFGGTSFDYGTAVDTTSDGGYVIAGATSSSDMDVSGFHGGSTDMMVLKIDSVGNLQWSKTMGGTHTDDARSIKQTLTGNYIIAGFSGSSNGDVTVHHGDSIQYDFWIVKLGKNISTTYNNTILKDKLTLYPNPANTYFTVSGVNAHSPYTIIDITGRVLLTGELSGDNELFIGAISPGLYLLQVGGDYPETVKFVRE